MSETKTEEFVWPQKEEDVSAKTLIDFYLKKSELLNTKITEIAREDTAQAVRLISEMHGAFTTAWLLSVMIEEAGETYADDQAKRVWWIAESGEYGEYAHEIRKKLQ